MSDHEDRLDSVRERAGTLAGSGRWSELWEELSALDPGAILDSAVLAYRFGEALYHTGRMRELETFADRYATRARAELDDGGAMRALNLGGIAAFELGDVEGAEARWDELLGLADGWEDEDMLARAANNLGALSNLRGKPNQAVAFYRLSLPLYQRLGQTRGIAQTYHNLGVAMRDLERFEDADSAFSRAVVVAEGIPYPPVVAMTLVSRAELEVRRADPPMAAELATRALALAREMGDPISEGQALRVRGLARCLSGDESSGAADLEAALERAEQTGNGLLEAETLRDLGRRPSLEPSASADLLGRAIERFEALGATAEAERIRADMPEE
ncbi:MAG: tetratricopeptide repeat protein [Gemmatimonadota bacterium]